MHNNWCWRCKQKIKDGEVKYIASTMTANISHDDRAWHEQCRPSMNIMPTMEEEQSE